MGSSPLKCTEHPFEMYRGPLEMYRGSPEMSRVTLSVCPVGSPRPDSGSASVACTSCADDSRNCTERYLKWPEGLWKCIEGPVGVSRVRLRSPAIGSPPSDGVSSAVPKTTLQNVQSAPMKCTERFFEMYRGASEMSRVPFGRVSSEVVGAPQRPIDIRQWR
jgi:hypothetical protein